ncbi:translation initiation factor IF-2 [Oryctolagus cuniculus]|uniref:translation initiation factor IF-2 n=1 Tax=Oryctolagus cuniculus TaxID=9986 RepID=UPI00387A1E02
MRRGGGGKKAQRQNKQTNKAPRSATNFRARRGEPGPAAAAAAAAATQLRGPLWGGPRGGRGQRSPRRAPSDASGPAGPAAARGHRRRGRPARTKLPAPAPSPTAAAAPAAPHAAPRPRRLTSAARPARSRAATGKKEAEEALAGECGTLKVGGGCAVPGSGRRVAPPSAFGKKWGVGARLGEGASSRRGGGDAGDPRALWPPAAAAAAAARLGSSRPRSQQVPRRARGEGRARRRRACSLLAWRRGARRRRARAVLARSRTLALRTSLHPGGRTRSPARGQDKERGGDPAGWPLPPWAAESVQEEAGARAPSRGAAVPRGGFRPGPASGARLPIGLPASPGLDYIPRTCAGAAVRLGSSVAEASPGRVVGSPLLLREPGDGWVLTSRARGPGRAASCPSCEQRQGQGRVLGVEGGRKALGWETSLCFSCGSQRAAVAAKGDCPSDALKT